MKVRWTRPIYESVYCKSSGDWYSEVKGKTHHEGTIQGYVVIDNEPHAVVLMQNRAEEEPDFDWVPLGDLKSNEPRPRLTPNPWGDQ